MKRYVIRIERDICLETFHEVEATSEAEAIARAHERLHAGDWFAGEVTNDWIKSVRLSGFQLAEFRRLERLRAKARKAAGTR